VTTAEAIVERLRERLAPLHLELRDESARHAGHAGASSGGGHFRLVVVSAAFAGLARIEQHRLVHAALSDLMRERIHALSITTYLPGEWDRGEGSG
jgi:BolA protein